MRSHKALSLSLNSPLIVLYGLNGAGKTNILEALSLLGGTRGLRRAKIGDLCCRGNDPLAPWAVAAKLMIDDHVYTLSTGLEPDFFLAQKEKRIAKWEGETVSIADLGCRMGVVWLTPELDSLFRDRPSHRRAFLDKWVAILDPSHTTRLNRYEQAMSERSRLLKHHSYQRHATWLAGLEEIMAQESVAIYAARLHVIESLNTQIQSVHTAFPKGIISLSGELTPLFDTTAALVIEDTLRDLLCESRGADALSGRTGHGAHKCDLEVLYLPKNIPVSYCSTGEQKTMLLSMTLAFAMMVKRSFMGVPLLLLDEVVAHLDEERRCGLFETLETLGVQAWMTGTEKIFFHGIDDRCQFLHVNSLMSEECSA